jgi:hypothetical protein
MRQGSRKKVKKSALCGLKGGCGNVFSHLVFFPKNTIIFPGSCYGMIDLVFEWNPEKEDISWQ